MQVLQQHVQGDGNILILMAQYIFAKLYLSTTKLSIDDNPSICWEIIHKYSCCTHLQFMWNVPDGPMGEVTIFKLPSYIQLANSIKLKCNVIYSLIRNEYSLGGQFLAKNLWIVA